MITSKDFARGLWLLVLCLYDTLFMRDTCYSYCVTKVSCNLREFKLNENYPCTARYIDRSLAVTGFMWTRPEYRRKVVEFLCTGSRRNPPRD